MTTHASCRSSTRSSRACEARALSARPRLVRGNTPHLRLAVGPGRQLDREALGGLGPYSVVMTERYAHLRPELFTQADLATIAVDLRKSSAKVGQLGHEPQKHHRQPAEEKENGQSRPVSRVLSRQVVAFPAVADIPLGPALPPASSERPGSAAGNRIAPLCALAPGGACRAARVATGAVRSYRTVSPLPAFAGGLFSVALSRESPRLAVSQHPALWSPDFPPARFEGAGVRPGGSDRVEF
jgi:hypothetical protein